jgi:hypothetical protein
VERPSRPAESRYSDQLGPFAQFPSLISPTFRVVVYIHVSSSPPSTIRRFP